MSKINENRKFAIYSRKSKYTGKGESVENQIEMCKQYIRLNHPDVTDENILIFEDEGFSGANTKRPQFQKMMTLIKNKEIQEIVCYRLDRISRNVSDFSSLIDELKHYNVAFASCNDKFDTSSPAGKAMMWMISVFAQFERDVIAERIRDNMHELAKTGRWLGGTAPTGYESSDVRKIDVDGKERISYKLGIIKDESELVKEIFSKFIELNSLARVETYLLNNNILTKNKVRFTRFALKQILTNPVYMIADEEAWNYFEVNQVNLYSEKSDFDCKHGIMAYNKTIQKTGKANEIREMNEWIVSVGKHKGIISGADWTKVQSLLLQNKSKSYRKPKSNVALLSGFLYCGNCGDFMRPKLSSRFNKEGERIYDYLCVTKEKSRNHLCKMKRPNGNTLDKLVCEQVKQLAGDNSVFLKKLEGIKKKITSTDVDYENKLQSLQKEFDNNNEQISNLIMHLAKMTDASTSDRINEEIKKLITQNESLQSSINEWKKLSENHILSTSDFDILKDLLFSFSNSFETLSIEQKRTALRTFINKIVWDGENAHIYLFGTDPDPDSSKGHKLPNDLHLDEVEDLEPKGEHSK